MKLNFVTTNDNNILSRRWQCLAKRNNTKRQENDSKEEKGLNLHVCILCSIAHKSQIPLFQPNNFKYFALNFRLLKRQLHLLHSFRTDKTASYFIKITICVYGFRAFSSSLPLAKVVWGWELRTFAQSLNTIFQWYYRMKKAMDLNEILL